MRTRRSLIALVGAYALALQALLAAFAPPVLAAGEIAVTICRPGVDPDGAPAPRDQHQSCLACLAGHCGGAGCDRTASLAPLPVSFVALAALEPAPVRLVGDLRLRPHEARGPPAV